MTNELELLRAEILVLQQDLSAALDNLHESWLALRRLREDVEIRSGVPIDRPEHRPPTFAAEAEQIARGMIAIYERALAADTRADAVHASLKRLVDTVRRLEPTTDAGRLSTHADFLAAEDLVTEREIARRADRPD
jgi:hypothetical protein